MKHSSKLINTVALLAKTSPDYSYVVKFKSIILLLDKVDCNIKFHNNEETRYLGRIFQDIGCIIL